MKINSRFKLKGKSWIVLGVNSKSKLVSVRPIQEFGLLGPQCDFYLPHLKKAIDDEQTAEKARDALRSTK